MRKPSIEMIERKEKKRSEKKRKEKKRKEATRSISRQNPAGRQRIMFYIIVLIIIYIYIYIYIYKNGSDGAPLGVMVGGHAGPRPGRRATPPPV
jgi:uncharacterized membrane protein (DUF106 family)